MEVVKLRAWKSKGFVTKVEMEGGIDTYAKNFLNIFNNVKSSSGGLLKVWNDYENGVYVYYLDEDDDSNTYGYKSTAVEEWLSQFGKVQFTRQIEVFTIPECDLPDTDWDKFDEQVVVTD